ncbi:class III extradiol dioxygenase subunit beta [Pseudomonas sp. BN102]|uniref:class III extradiol dioxygenase subunit beta n=1 Tax=Pseudomonas sp. BN102 TaxID=2567886 RepID=UPI002453DFA1|nr:class III extradiol dioxygenase subunit beta [Pseudomonas sp. BN102]MDH4611553.1 protocatechuate 3,4-dioxygenase [Pseudomonas sp. BN102]
MAKIIAGLGTSHVPAIGAAIDHEKTQESYWKPLFEGIQPARQWINELKPDVCIIVYNDHASAFSLEAISTFAIGVAPEFLPADEGYGPRKVPAVKGNSKLAWHIAESLIKDEFDMTIVNEMPVDHGLTVPLSLMYDKPDVWPCEVIPLCVNVIQYPQPTANRCYNLGKSICRAVESYPEAIRVAIVGTGGLSHQLQGERAGLINSDFDENWLDDLVSKPEELKNVSHTEYLREAGSEGIEMIMWFIMRGALDERVKQVYRFTHCPVSNTNYGLLALENES